ncbi:MAG: hypothetical protein Q7W56_10720 [Candidatus Latescibacteria bacterium]|nr:hypothetical protein [Candidatus Latescibacterota bacterium]
MRHIKVLLTILSLVLAVTAVSQPTAASASAYSITWLDMSPTAIGSVVPNGSVFFVPGIGNVTVTYSIPAHWTHGRNQNPLYTVGSVTSGLDTYSWSNYEHFGTIFVDGLLGPESATITYTFAGTLPAGSVYVGTIGLGATTSFGGGASVTTVNQNGTFLGDYIGDVTAGASQFTGGAGTFSVQNSVTGAGGANPWWNTQLGVVRIDDAVSSITVHQSLIRGDGIGVNIGFVRDGIVANEAAAWGDVKALFK